MVHYGHDNSLHVIVVRIVGITDKKNTAAGGAVGIMPVITVLAQRETLASCIVRIPDAFAAALTFGGVAGHAVGTEEVIVEFEKIVGGDLVIAQGAGGGGYVYYLVK